MLEQKNKSRTRVRLAVFFVLSVHVVGLMALLMQGCRKPNEQEQPVPNTNAPAATPEQTNAPAPETSAPPAAATAPQPEATPAPAPAPSATEYVVVKGDTLSGIAKKFGTSVKAIEDANQGVEPTKLRIGQKLQIPAGTAGGANASAASAPGTAASSSEEQVYTVKSGDNLTKIAAQVGTTVKELRSLNNLTTDRIKVGQKLKVPVKAPASAPAPSPAPANSAPTSAPSSGM